MRFSFRRFAGPVFAVVLVLAGCGGANDEPTQPVAATGEVPAAMETSAKAEARDLHFYPATYGEEDRVVLPITFTDRTRAELIHPRTLDIAGLGGGPYGSGSLKGESPTPGRSDVVGRDFWIFYGEVEDVLLSLNGGQVPRLLAEYQGVGQKVGFWDIRSDDDADYLAFQFGRWAVLVYDYAADGHLPGAAMTDAERASWAASFSGRETPDGFLLLEGSGPLRLARAGEHAGPQFSFGSVEPQRSLTLYPGRCRPHRDQTRLVDGKLVEWSRGFADWCLSRSMRIHAGGTDRFIGALIRDLQVRNVAIASG
jgi:hypothetical protein